MGTAYGKDIDIPIQAAVECEVRMLRINGIIYTVIYFDYDQILCFQSFGDVDSSGGVSAVVTCQLPAVHIDGSRRVGSAEFQIIQVCFRKF